MKQLLKTIIYRLGLLTLFHRYRNKNTLTVLMLHRVLPEQESLKLGADPEWTITPELLDNVITFVKRNYSIISLKNLQHYQDPSNKSQLPKRALLLTFDDGWRDNFQYAQPILIKHNVSALIHQVSDCVDNQMLLWQEQLAILNKNNNKAYAELSDYFFTEQVSLEKFILAIGENAQKIERLRSLIVEKNPQAKTMMLDKIELKQMISQGFELSSHGKTHQKLSQLTEKEVEIELKTSAQALAKIAGEPITSISFPHGDVNKQVISLALLSGYKTLFTSEPVINCVTKKQYIWGRVHISSALTCIDNRFSPMKLAYLLFNRQISEND